MVERSTNQLPLLSIITPSYNMLRFLPICCSSVLDQAVDYEHIVIDGGSNDGTIEWLKNRPKLISISEKDDGMYDAINKGIRMSRGEIVSYLNCDEQYLPGVLQQVAEIFHRYPRVDILFGNTLMIRPNGVLLAFRKSLVPRWPYVWASALYVHSSSMFVRRRVFEAGIMFDKSWKAVGDMDFVIRVIRTGFRAHHVSKYFSAFMLTGSNLGHGEDALAELNMYRDKAPLWLKYSGLIARTLMRLEKTLHGAYWEKMPLSYSVYTIDNFEHRTDFIATSASSLYPRNE